MLYDRNYPNSCPLFRKHSFKKVKANFHAVFAPLLQLTFNIVDFYTFLGLNILIILF